MGPTKCHEEICKEHTDALELGSDQWFYGHHTSLEDYLKLVEAVKFFEDIKVQQRKKLIKEGII